MRESINASTTTICLIAPEDATRVFRHMAPIGDAKCIMACQTDLSRDDAWRRLRDSGYRLQSLGNTIYVVVEHDDMEGARIAADIAKTIFGVTSPRITVIYPASSQAGLAAAARR